MSKLQKRISTLEQQHKGTALINQTAFRSFSTTYAQLGNHIKDMGKLFSKYKIKKGDRVMIWGENSPQWATSMIGCFLYGIVAVPVDIRHPLEVVRRIAKHSGAKLAICPANYPRTVLKRININDLFFDLAKYPRKNKKPPQAKENDLCQIVYTSGTTGVPKGVMISHKNIISNIEQIHTAYQFKGEISLLSVLPLSHLFGQVGGLLYPLFYGHEVTLVNTLKPSSLIEAFKEHKITHMPVVPKLLEGFKNKLPFPVRLTSKRAFGRKFSSFIVGGAAIDEDTESFFNRLGYGPYVGYGLTETSPVLSANTPGNYTFQTAGRPVKDTKIKIAKDGEILAKGPQVFSGYYKNKKTTEEVLKNGWFYTGDLGKIDEDGNVVILGRKKDIIVTAAGVNVYPEDIEHLLNNTKGVKDSCVVGIGKNDDQIHAVLLLSQKVSAREVVLKANAHLDDTSRITSHSIWTEPDFPRTPTAKIRKFKVREWVKSRGKKQGKAKKGDLLIEIISRLTSDTIKEKSSLESLGLSSLDRIELVSLLEQQYSIDLDEDKFTPTLKVSQLRRLLSGPSKIKRPSRWQVGILSRMSRVFLRPLSGLILMRPFCDYEITGRDNLSHLDKNAIFISNHTSHFDAPSLFHALPNHISSRLCIATWKEFFDSKNIFKRIPLLILEFLAKLSHAIFLLPQEGGAMRSMRHAGWLLDHGWNILYYPEGRRTRTGKLLSFMPGIGLLVKATRAPVVPVKIEGLFDILPAGRSIPKKGKVRIIIGKPIEFTTESAVQIVKVLEKKMKKL